METNRTKMNKVYSIFSIIFIGAIGSGFWDLFLKDLLFFTGNFFVNVASSIYANYFDILYEGVGRQSDRLIYFPSIFLFVFIIMSPLFAYIKLRILFLRLGENNESNEKEKPSLILKLIQKKDISAKLIFFIPIFSVSIMYIHLLITAVSTTAAVKAIERRIEIVRPYIDDQKFYFLVSEFRLIEDRKLLQTIVNNIESIAIENKVKLPELKLYGIETSNKLIKRD